MAFTVTRRAISWSTSRLPPWRGTCTRSLQPACGSPVCLKHLAHHRLRMILCLSFAHSPGRVMGWYRLGLRHCNPGHPWWERPRKVSPYPGGHRAL